MAHESRNGSSRRRAYVSAPRGPSVAETPLPDRLWSAQEVSSFLGVPVSTLHQWRYLGTGPDAYRVGKHLRYNPEAVREWLDAACRGKARV